MTHVNEDIERLIVRHLDGALSEDEELALNRELIRNPAAHRLLEEYKQVDELAGAALEQAFTNDGLPFDPQTLSAPSRRRRSGGYYRIWWLVPGAVAAALLALAIPRPPSTPDAGRPPAVAGLDEQPRRMPRHDDPIRNAPGGVMRQVSSPAMPRVKRDTGREFFGVLGDDGNIYWVEVNRTRTVRQASPQVARQWVSGGV